MEPAERNRFWTYLPPHTKSRVSEHLAERGMMDRARQYGYETRLSPFEASGFDAVFRDRSGFLVIGEAKGTGVWRRLEELLGTGYGVRQGTTEWCLRAADAVKRSRTASDKEKAVAQEIIDAANAGRLRVEVFVTQHHHGQRPVTTAHTTASVK
jgi:hypothetical protein